MLMKYLHCVILAVALTAVVSRNCKARGLIDVGDSFCYGLSSEKGTSFSPNCGNDGGSVIANDESNSLYASIISESSESSGDTTFWVSVSQTYDRCFLFDRSKTAVEAYFTYVQDTPCYSSKYQICQYSPDTEETTVIDTGDATVNDLCPTDYVYDDTYGTNLCYTSSNAEYGASMGIYSCDLVTSQDLEFLNWLAWNLGLSGEVFYIDNSGLASDMVRVFDDWNLEIVESSYVDHYRALCFSSPVGSSESSSNSLVVRSVLADREQMISTTESIPTVGKFYYNGYVFNFLHQYYNLNT
ncbi:uncharacterized protein [Apostichopus japonicus]|uniref:uncharacterized protein n=1 Tax=Stichopus japonicus TaxID=307972 RepID=UPI003AB82988